MNQLRWGPCASRLVLVVMTALGGAVGCGADENVDPGQLELRDLLGVTPRTAAAWDDDQRAAARLVLAGGLAGDEREALEADVAVDRQAEAVRALVLIDDRRLAREQDALGLVVLDRRGPPESREIEAPGAAALLEGGQPAPAEGLPPVLELDERAWPCPAGQGCDLNVLAALAADAAPGATRVRVVPVPQLTTIAALLDSDGSGTPVLLVNPIVTAVGEPTPATAAASSGGAGIVGTPAWMGDTPITAIPLNTSTWEGEATIAACAAQVQSDCGTCLAGGLCEPVWPGITGMEACTMLAADVRNYQLVCVNLALSLDAVGACILERGAQCPFNANAIDTPAALDANDLFVDDFICRETLAICLDQVYGARDDGSGCGCGSCDGCDCGGCDDSTNTNDDCGSSSNMPDDGCNNSGGDCGSNDGGCSSSGDGGNCGNSGGGNSGNCAVGRQQPGRGASVALGLMWVLLPVPAALLARRRGRRRGRPDR